MYLDALLLVSDAQAVTATAVATNVINLGAVTPRRQIGTGEAMGFGVAVDVAADFTTGDETYQFDILSDDDVAIGSPKVIASFIRTAAELAAGSLHFLPLPQGFPKEQYLTLRYTTGGTSPSVTVTAWLTTHTLFSLTPANYAKGYTITG